ncbi:ABC transporter permease [Erysipelothrix anatis]|uniref:ABC transporter permease n=1 Tax=Erysipelothrix anatis TaxID=2683713 RepID=UPI00135A908D|nr:ABC transporter permease [Erysipelothrix anatis]
MLKQFKYRLKILLSDKGLLFWTLVFPMVIALLFNFALRDAYNATPLEKMEIAYVESYNSDMDSLLDVLELDVSLVSVQRYESQEEAISALEEGLVVAILSMEPELKLTLGETGYTDNLTILQNVLTSYTTKQTMIQSELETNPKLDVQRFIESVLAEHDYVLTNSENKANELVTINFYTTIAMLCIYASQWGAKSGRMVQANMNKVGIRTQISPTKKMSVVLVDLAAVYLIFVVEYAIHLLYLKFILDVDMGSQVLMLITTGLVGGLFSSAMGYTLAVVAGKNESFTANFVSFIGVFLTFLAGMQSVQIKYLIDTKLPIINMLNPAALITDNFYRSYIDADMLGSVMNIGIMLGFTFVLAIVAYRKLKVAQYDHI